jgi:LCP family protein required for cell wall assembly
VNEQPVAPRGRGRRVGRFLSWVALCLCVTLLLASGAGYLAYRHYLGRIGKVKGLGDLSAGHHKKGEAENFLLVGSDTSDHLTNAQLREIGVNRTGRSGTRTDTIILVHVPADGSGARLVSFPRDSYVAIPGHGRNKLNSAFTFGELTRSGGGPASIIATIQNLTGLHIDHYVQISLYGFYTVTNAVGGVDVCLSKPAHDVDANIDLPAGHQVLHGKAALAFVRQRHGLPGEDLGRIRRQQYFIGALVRQVLSAHTFLNPFRINRILIAAGDSIEVDRGTSGQDLVDLAMRLQKVAAGKVEFQTVPVLDAGARVHLPGHPRASVVLLDTARLPAFFQDLDHRTPVTPGQVRRTHHSTGTTTAAEHGCIA